MIVLFAGSSFLSAQEIKRNSIEFGIASFGLSINYHRNINSFFDVGAAGFFGDGLFAITGAQVQGRLHPLQGVFFFELGLGYAKIEEDPDSLIIKFDGDKGFMVHPGLGWQFGLGRNQNLLFVPAISIPLIFGQEKQVGTILLRLSLGLAF